MNGYENQDEFKHAQVAALVADWLDTYYDISLPMEKLSAWANVLADWPYETLRECLKRYPLQNRSRTPNLASLLNALGESKGASEISNSERLKCDAELAWGMVMDAVRYQGRNKGVRFNNHIIHNCIQRIGGWDELCNCDADKDLKFKHKDFLEEYALCCKMENQLPRLECSGNPDKAEVVDASFLLPSRQEEVRTYKLPMSEEQFVAWVKEKCG